GSDHGGVTLVEGLGEPVVELLDRRPVLGESRALGESRDGAGGVEGSEEQHRAHDDLPCCWENDPGGMSNPAADPAIRRTPLTDPPRLKKNDPAAGVACVRSRAAKKPIGETTIHA